MDNDLMNIISVEKFAAFLDENLSLDEMQDIESMVEKDVSMQDIYNVSSMVDETISNYSPEELVLPNEIIADNFELPLIIDDSCHQTYFDVENCIAASICADTSDVPNSSEGTFFNNNTEANNTDNIENTNDISDGTIGQDEEYNLSNFNE